MGKAMECVQDLIEEAKLRMVWWGLCVFGVSYFLTHTSKSMLLNIPIAVLFVCGLRILVNEVEFRWKVRNTRPVSYLSHLEKKQLPVNDYRLTTQPPPQKWKRKIDSPVVEAATEDFISKILQDFVTDLWYSDITPDKEAPQLIHDIIMDALGEVAGRLKEVNLVDLLTRDVVDMIGDHIDLFRRNQAAIGVDVMGTLSSEERDERLKHHLLASKELHPALISPDCEYKVLQRLMGGVLAVVLRPRDAQSPLVRCIARELLTCLVMQPILNFASPEYINELIEYIIIAYKNENSNSNDRSPNADGYNRDHTVPGKHSGEADFEQKLSSINQGIDLPLTRYDHKREPVSGAAGNIIPGSMLDEQVHPRPADWAKVFEAATQRREEVLMPENLENMWTIGRNYKKKLQKKAPAGHSATKVSGDSVTVAVPRKDLLSEAPTKKPETSSWLEDKSSVRLPPRPQQDAQLSDLSDYALSQSRNVKKDVFPERRSSIRGLENNAAVGSHENRNKLKRSNSASDLVVQSNLEDIFANKGSTSIIAEYYSADANKFSDSSLKSKSAMVLRSEGLHSPKLRCRVIGAYFEKLGSKSFAVYSIAVTDADNSTWFVKRRYSNFERLHRHLKDIPNYTLHLPPKRIFSSSTEDAFVHQRCIQLDKYLQDLLSIANVAEQHEVWDFLSASSKNYSFGKSSSVMRTLAVNVDDAMDDIVRQVKGVSDGLLRAVVGSPSSEPSSSVTSRHLSWNADEINKLVIRQSTSESVNSFSDNEDGDKDVNHEQQELESSTQTNGWHSDNELHSKGFPPRVINRGDDVSIRESEEFRSARVKSESSTVGRSPESSLALTSVPQEDLTGVPPEWTPPNLSVPVLNLVDNVFQLNRRGWLRRQVFWISKQILQLVMEDAIDDWLLRQIQWLRREDVIAHGIRWVQDILWPNGTFFLRLRIQRQLNDSLSNTGSQQTSRQGGGRTQPGSFQQQLEAARKANDVKKMIFNGAPSTLVSLIGHRQYRRCARDIYYFLQSTVCLKQLGYGILELVLVSVFPELRDLVKDIHEKVQAQSV